jgi:hypothetical protein
LKAALGSSTGTSTNVTVNYIHPVDGNIATWHGRLGNVNTHLILINQYQNAAQQAINVLRLKVILNTTNGACLQIGWIHHGMQQVSFSNGVIGIDGAGI